MIDLASFAPDWVSPPGETIADLLAERGWTQAELAGRLGHSTKHVNDVVQGKAGITPETASRLADVLGSTAGFWLRREAQYRAAQEAERIARERQQHAGWLAALPVRQMARFGWIRKSTDAGAQVTECLRFFGVASPEVWRKQYETRIAAFRTSSGLSMDVGAVAAWLRQGEREAEARACRPFSEAAFKNALGELRGLTGEADPKVFVPKLIARAAACGVAVAFVPAPKGCPASGATRWLAPDKALLLLSLRYGTNDHLWFTFFHEAAHLLLHAKRMQFIEGVGAIDAGCEAEADAFARDLLIPASAFRQLRERAAGRAIGRSMVEAFAQEIGVASGIVVGRLQKEGLLPWKHLNHLKVRYSWGSRTAD